MYHFSLNCPNYLKKKQINDIRTSKTLDVYPFSFNSFYLLMCVPLNINKTKSLIDVKCRNLIQALRISI